MTLHFYYKIHKDDLSYIGRTTNPKNRFSTHKAKAQTSNIHLYQRIRENGGWDEFKVDVLEIKAFDNPEDAYEHERALYNQHNPNMNTCVPYGNPKANSYYQANKERLRVIARERYTKTKTEWKTPKKTPEQMKTLHLNKMKRTKKQCTALTQEKYEITDDEIATALAEE
jgi:hypothetical protein